MNAVQTFRWVSVVEGASLLLLVLIAMPLKYLWGMPQAVKVVGSLHGLLFCAFVLSLFRAHLEHDWPWQRSMRYFGLSFLPFGFWWIERDVATKN